ncbi:MAG: hypothetical protein M9921_02635 [Fimbriimonadaceae bacterium]|nr:hypothetical protein [Chthonomonadaceae bacterium]MCO5295729.1 hypothetical protein [Fimbriimonadaceae bacterium]
MIDAAMTLREVAFAVCSALEGNGITAVLTGGSAATLCAPEEYQSRDIDWVTEWRGAQGVAVLAEREGHPDRFATFARRLRA